MTDLTNFTDTSDVSDAAIKWVSQALGSEVSANNVRACAVGGSMSYHARILAARLIQQHRPDLLVDPVDAIVREELAKAYEEVGMAMAAHTIRVGNNGNREIFTAAKRLYLMGIEKGKGA